MKHIAIVTYHRTNNYGAALQAYALQRVLSRQYKTDILDYRSPYLEKLYLRNALGIKERVRGLIRRVFYPIRTKQLDRRSDRFAYFYKKYYSLSPQIYDEDCVTSANCNYDLFVAGSDQVWNPHLSRGDWNYFLEFAPAHKRYSYAASVSITNSEEVNKRIEHDLNQFEHILVREKKAVTFLKSLGINRDIAAVCDPVFLLPATEWEKIISEPESEEQTTYVLVYTVANVTKSLEFAKKLAHENRIKVISIASNQSVRTINGVKNVLDAGPIEFLQYIKRAAYVVTSSFHALAFSIIFNIPFYYELCKDGSNNNDRLENIAEIFSLKNREILSDRQITQIDSIDWKSVNSILENYRQKSMDILFDSLKENGSDRDE